MSEHSLLQQLLNAHGAPLINLKEIINEINGEFCRTPTTAQRITLLQTFKTVMDIVEARTAPEDLEAFKESRLKLYRTYLVQEATVGENVSVKMLNAITQREIAAARMTSDDEFRKLAEVGMFALADTPHLQTGWRWLPTIMQHKVSEQIEFILSRWWIVISIGGTIWLWPSDFFDIPFSDITFAIILRFIGALMLALWGIADFYNRVGPNFAKKILENQRDHKSGPPEQVEK